MGVGAVRVRVLRLIHRADRLAVPEPRTTILLEPASVASASRPSSSFITAVDFSPSELTPTQKNKHLLYLLFQLNQLKLQDYSD